MNKYGLAYNYLNKDEQYAYNLFDEALRKKATSLNISGVKRKVDLMLVMNAVLGDNPSCIYFNKTLLRTMQSFFGKSISFTGCMSRRQEEKCSDELKRAVESAAWEIDKTARNDREILQGISEYLQRTVKYDLDEYRSSGSVFGKSNPTSHNAYGALVNHLAVCDGISSAYALLAHYFGIRCTLVSGSSSRQRDNGLDHGWNIVEYQGEFFHVDATWDLNCYEATQVYSYDYFGLDDSEIALDHVWNINKTPKCASNKLSYFISNGLYVQSTTQLEDTIIRSLKKREATTRVKLSQGFFIKDGLDDYMDSVLKRVAYTNGVKSYHFSWVDALRCVVIKWEYER